MADGRRSLPGLLVLALATGTVGGCTTTGYEALFDGESLTGWVTEGGRYDGNARWTIEDGAITGREGLEGEGGLIYTELAYDDFEFEVEIKLDEPFDSGIFLRMTPEAKGAQVTIDYRPGGEVGGIYSDGWLQHNSAGAERFKAGDWNHFRVLCSGENMRVTAFMNGELLTHYELPPGSTGYARTGLIGLQVHGAMNAPPSHRVQFRGMRVREIEAAEHDAFFDTEGLLEITDLGEELGWTSLFNGHDLEGWELSGATEEHFEIVDGVLGFRNGAGGYIATTEDFRDFELRLDFELGFMANSGVFLRSGRDGGNPSFTGCEVQILDDFNWETETNSTLRDYQLTGGLYGSVPPGTREALRPPGEWNTYRITYRGTRMRTILNDVVLYDVDTLDVPGDPPFADRVPEGFIGLQQHAPAQAGEGVYVRFRNIFVRPL